MMLFPTGQVPGDNDGMTTEEIREIQEWIGEWLYLATAQNLIRPSDAIENAMIMDIQAYYEMKMSPEEAVFACHRIKRESTLF